jgi:hypothetical protein
MDLNGTPVARTLSFTSRTVPLLALRQEFLKQAAGPWSHREEQEVRLRQLSAGGLDEDAIVLGFSGANGKNLAFNFWQTDGGYELTSFLDLDGEAVLPDQVYDLMNELKHTLLDPITASMPISIELGADFRALESLTSPTVIKALVDLTSKGNGSTHEHSWDSFVVQSYLSGEPLEQEILLQWLSDATLFDGQEVRRLIQSYLDGLRLLGAFQARLA